MAELDGKGRYLELQQPSHYHVWADSVATELEANGLLGYALDTHEFWTPIHKPVKPEGTDAAAALAYQEAMEDWSQKDAKTRKIIQSRVAVHHRIVPSLTSRLTAREIWKHYESTMRTTDSTSYSAALSKLLSITLRSCGGSHEKYCSQYNSAMTHLNMAANSFMIEANAYLDRHDKDAPRWKMEDLILPRGVLAMNFAHGTSSYDYLRLFFTDVTNRGNIPSVEQMMQRLRNEPQPTRKADLEFVKASTSHNATATSTSTKRNKTIRQCNHCKRLGHLEAECFQRYPELRSTGVAPSAPAGKSKRRG